MKIAIIIYFDFSQTRNKFDIWFWHFIVYVKHVYYYCNIFWL